MEVEIVDGGNKVYIYIWIREMMMMTKLLTQHTEGAKLRTTPDFMFPPFHFQSPPLNFKRQIEKSSKTMSSSQEPRSPFRNDILKDRVVLISGGATGIGFDVCFRSARQRKSRSCRRRKKIEESVKIEK